MIQNTAPLFLYIEKENIIIDKSEYEFQIQSHPDYPSLLAISDTLNFFNVETFVAKVDFKYIDNLPDKFIAQLNRELSSPQLYLIEKIGNDFFYTNDKKALKIDKKQLEKRWTDIVLLVEKSENEKKSKPVKSNSTVVLQTLSLLFFVLVLSQLEGDYTSKFFFVFPVLGLLLSIAALKELFGAKSEFINKFCNISSSTSCNTVVGSAKWKIFEIVNFSDLSVVFFTSQFLGLLFFLLSNNVMPYFLIEKGLLFTAFPVLILSLYYQKFVEKKWCPICLAIMSIILLELGYLFIFFNDKSFISILSVTIFLLVFMFVIITWSALKKILTKQKELKEFQLESIRFARNYMVFKNSLLASEKTNYRALSSGNLILGNENANLKITVVSNPFCGHCSSVHYFIEEILKKHTDNICIDIRFNFNVKLSDDKSLKVHQKLIDIYYENGQEVFMKALHDWFENKDENKLLASENLLINDSKINEILNEQYLMNEVNKVTFTPAIIINQFLFPKMYNRKDLIYFIDDLLEDDEFLERKYEEMESCDVIQNVKI